MEEMYGVVFVAAAGNDPVVVNEWPALAAPYLEGMLVVGATNKKGTRAWFSAFGDDIVHAWAPGHELPSPPGGISFRPEQGGTSFGKAFCLSVFSLR